MREKQVVCVCFLRSFSKFISFVSCLIHTRKYTPNKILSNYVWAFKLWAFFLLFLDKENKTWADAENIQLKIHCTELEKNPWAEYPIK